MVPFLCLSQLQSGGVPRPAAQAVGINALLRSIDELSTADTAESKGHLMVPFLCLSQPQPGGVPRPAAQPVGFNALLRSIDE